MLECMPPDPAPQALRDSIFTKGAIAIVAAHPDDETLGAGALLAGLPHPILIHITDGAPRDLRDAASSGFSRREDYAAARLYELQEALDAGGVRPRQTLALGYVDQEASLHLTAIALDLQRVLREYAVETVLVHPYEGGHPDHDATAFAVHAACSLLPAASRPQIVEFTSYHSFCAGSTGDSRGGQIETGVFLPGSGIDEIVVTLDAEQRARKRGMLACFRTQQRTLQQFEIAQERFRPAPTYDFSRPAHASRLFYEQFPWGMNRDRWLALAAEARHQLGLC